MTDPDDDVIKILPTHVADAFDALDVAILDAIAEEPKAMREALTRRAREGHWTVEHPPGQAGVRFGQLRTYVFDLAQPQARSDA